MAGRVVNDYSDTNGGRRAHRRGGGAPRPGDGCAPFGASVWAGGWFADNSSTTNSGVLVLRATTDKPGAELELDVDGFSASNNTSIVTPQPAGGWKANITETQFLCFYDTTTWPLSHRQAGKAVTLPAGCGP